MLRSERRYRPHLLSEPEERISAEKSVTGASAWGRLFNELLSDLRIDLDGEKVSVDQALSRLSRLTEQDERRQRRRGRHRRAPARRCARAATS